MTVHSDSTNSYSIPKKTHQVSDSDNDFDEVQDTGEFNDKWDECFEERDEQTTCSINYDDFLDDFHQFVDRDEKCSPAVHEKRDSVVSAAMTSQVGNYKITDLQKNYYKSSKLSVFGSSKSQFGNMAKTWQINEI